MATFELVDHHLMVNGNRIEYSTFEVHPSRFLVNAPGVMQFSAESLDDARDQIRALFDRKAVQ